MGVLRLIDRVLARIEGWLLIIFLGLMVALTFVQVILRSLYTHGHIEWANFVLGHVDWAEPLARLLVLWAAFVGASLLTGDNKHIKIDILSSILPRRWLPHREVVLSIVSIVICALMLRASVEYVVLEKGSGGYLFLRFPFWIGQLILPAGFLLILFRFVLVGMEHLLEIFRKGKT